MEAITRDRLSVYIKYIPLIQEPLITDSAGNSF